MSAAIELSAWVEKLKSARNRTELFAMLDSFRILEWTDEQRASIAKLYIRLIEYLPHEQPVSDDTGSQSTGSTKPAEQEEVWYEKM